MRRHYATELARGTAAVHAAIAQTFVTKCLGGVEGDPKNPPDWRKASTPALIWYSKTRMGWSGRPNDDDADAARRTFRLDRDLKDI